MIDFHCHLDLYSDPSEVVRMAQKNNVGILSVTTTPLAWNGTVLLGEGHPVVRTALGLHPQLASERKHELELFDQFFSQAYFIGEIGLDGLSGSEVNWLDQLVVFEHILSCCNYSNKILSIHSRRSATYVLTLLEKYTGVNFPILHWFSGSQAELRRAINRDCWFSVGPAMLASNKGRTLVAKMPRNRILLETDGPFAKYQRAVLHPWDITVACKLLSEIWNVEYIEGKSIINNNEMNLLMQVGRNYSELDWSF